MIRNNLDILTLTETWLNDSDEDRAWLQLTDLNQEPYKLFTLNRETGKGGGLAMACRKNFEVTTLASGQNKTFLTYNMECPSEQEVISITGIYHPPQKDRVTNSMFIDDIMDHLASILPRTPRNLILEDFNIHVDDVQDNDALAFSDTMMALGLDQCVNSSI